MAKYIISAEICNIDISMLLHKITYIIISFYILIIFYDKIFYICSRKVYAIKNI